MTYDATGANEHRQFGCAEGASPPLGKTSPTAIGLASSLSSQIASTNADKLIGAVLARCALLQGKFRITGHA